MEIWSPLLYTSCKVAPWPLFDIITESDATSALNKTTGMLWLSLRTVLVLMSIGDWRRPSQLGLILPQCDGP